MCDEVTPAAAVGAAAGPFVTIGSCSRKSAMTSLSRRSPLILPALLLATAALSGCGVISLAGSAAGAAVSVTGAVVSTGVKVTGKVVEKAIDIAVPGDSDE
jgi:hypothetical protein